MRKNGNMQHQIGMRTNISVHNNYGTQNKWQDAIMQNEIFQGKIKIEQLQRFTKRYKMNE